MVEDSGQAGADKREITEAMVLAAAREICEAGITPYPADPVDFLVPAREILEAALRARRQS